MLSTGILMYVANNAPLNLFTVQNIELGSLHGLAIGLDGSLSAWGNNSSGQLGDGTYTNRSTPIKINVPPIASVAAYEHTLVLGRDGGLSACGDNSFGQLGDGTKISRNTLKKINLPPVASIAASIAHGLAIGLDGSLSAWGNNSSGQLGDGTYIEKLSPVRINLPPVVSVAAGRDFSLAVGSDGGLSAWGDNSFGQLGDGTNIPINTPKKINLPPVARVACGDHTSVVAIGTDGGLSAWGWNYGFDYEPTTGDIFESGYNPTPKKINLPAAAAVSLGYNHTLILGTNGELSAWGDNGAGQLGVGTNTTDYAPGHSFIDVDFDVCTADRYIIKKIAVPPISSIAAKYNSSLALSNNYSLSAWGLNNSSQLGDGSNINRNTPVKVF